MCENCEKQNKLIEKFKDLIGEAIEEYNFSGLEILGIIEFVKQDYANFLNSPGDDGVNLN